MSAPCPPTIPAYYTLTLHIIGAISLPVNAIGFYMVWFQSPGMFGYKYCLCYMQTASFVTEIYMSWVCPAFYFFPMVGGYNTGEFFGQFISPHMSMSIWVGIFCFELSAGLTCFVYRHNAAVQINQNQSSKMHFNKLLLFITHIFPFFTAISMWNSSLTYQQKYDFVKKNYPQCLFWMAFDGFEAYDPHQNPWMFVTGIGALIWVFFIVWYCVYLGVHTMIILQRLRQHMSSQTYNMHRAALFSLSMQMALPGGLIVIPKNIMLFIVIGEATHLQELATNMTFLMASHSMCQCSTMILSNSVYRRIFREKLAKTFRLKFLAPESHMSSIEASMRTNSFVQKNAPNAAPTA